MLEGRKTYILSALTIIAAGVAVSQGWIDKETAAVLIANSGLASTLRHGVSKA